MSDSEAYFRQLLEDYLNNTCSPQQVEEVFDFLSRDLSDSWVLQQMQEEFNRIIDRPEPIAAGISDAVRNRLIRQIGPPIVIPFYRKLSFRAAAIAGFILLGGYWWYAGSTGAPAHMETVAHAPYSNDLKPGGNKAILTLGNGSTIILDSAKNGSLTKQGNSQVTKLGNGLIAYNPQASKSREIIYNTLSTPKGGQYQVTLSDGTRVWLNAASSIRFPTAFSGNQRMVEISGEVYFEVAQNASLPFVVKNTRNDSYINVLGTRFNVNAYEDESALKVTLLEGAVDVSDGPSHDLIRPGEQAVVSNHQISIAAQTDLNAVMAWKDGRFYFDGADIKTIMRQVAKWYDVDVQYNADIKYSFVADISRNVNVSKLLGLLELTGLVHFKIEGNKITVNR